MRLETALVPGDPKPYTQGTQYLGRGIPDTYLLTA